MWRVWSRSESLDTKRWSGDLAMPPRNNVWTGVSSFWSITKKWNMNNFPHWCNKNGCELKLNYSSPRESRHLRRPARRFIKQKFQDFLFLDLILCLWIKTSSIMDPRMMTGHGRRSNLPFFRTVFHIKMGNLSKNCM